MTNAQFYIVIIVPMIAALLTALANLTVVLWTNKGLRDYIDAKFSSVDKRFDGVNQRFDGVNQRFEGVERTLAFFLDHFADHNSRIPRLEGRQEKE